MCQELSNYEEERTQNKYQNSPPQNIVTKNSFCLWAIVPSLNAARSFEYSLTNWFSSDGWGEWWLEMEMEATDEMRKFHYKCCGAPLDKRKSWSFYNIVMRPSHHITSTVYKVRDQDHQEVCLVWSKSFPDFKLIKVWWSPGGRECNQAQRNSICQYNY